MSRSGATPAGGPLARDRALLVFCSVAVAFAAVDTYVVVLALPDMMAGVGIPVDELQRAAPIVSGFLLGYVAMLPLIGRIADLRGQVPVLAMSLVLFSIGSLVTAVSYDLPSMVAGRFLQGVGGGGLVPATMSLVAALYPVERRGLPLGLVSAVQEFGSVLGPLFGALVLSFTTWRGIFAINLAGGAVLLVAVSVLARPSTPSRSPSDPGRSSSAAREGRASGVSRRLASRRSSNDPGRSSSAAREGRASGVSRRLASRRSSNDPGRSSSAAREERASGVSRRLDTHPAARLATRAVAVLLLGVTTGAGLITFIEPSDLQRDLTWGQLFIPYVDGGNRWITPIGVATVVAFLALVLWCWFLPRALVDLRGWLGHLLAADLLGAALLATALGGIVLAFATADPEVAVFSPQGPWFLGGSLIALVLLLLHLRRADDPIVPRGALRATPAWGSLVVSFLVGWALIAALVDIPLFARTTTERESQLGAALVLLRFLAALPVGAVVGGWLLRRVNAGVLTAVGMAAAGVSFLAMAQWDATSLDGFGSNIPLVLGGFGFGLALAPVNAAILASTDDDAHGLASALVVVARMVGMLVGISALTTIGLRRLYAAQESDPSLSILELGIVQEHSVFVGAAVAAFAAGVLALVLFARARTRGVDTAEALHAAG